MLHHLGWLIPLTDTLKWFPATLFFVAFPKEISCTIWHVSWRCFSPSPEISNNCCRVYVNCSFRNKFSRSDVLNKRNYIQPQLVWEAKNNLFDFFAKKFLLPRDLCGSFSTWKLFKREKQKKNGNDGNTLEVWRALNPPQKEKWINNWRKSQAVLPCVMTRKTFRMCNQTRALPKVRNKHFIRPLGGSSSHPE